MRRLLFAILLTMGVLPVLATTFTVTSNGDSGPGTLRDAIQKAAANGLGSTNVIVFNIADQSQAGRTIALASILPLLSSNLTIDGTTQSGAPFGASNAKVIITSSAPTGFDFFRMNSVSNIHIYGLWLKSVGTNNCFHFNYGGNLQFGAAGKGNLIQGFANVFYSDLNGGAFGTYGVTIQGNIMGTDPTGTTAGPTTLNTIDFWLRNVANLQIGGLNTGEGNLMVEESTPMDYSNSFNNNFGSINIEGNKQGTDITGSFRLSPSHFYFSIDGWANGINAPAPNAPAQVNIINNVSVGGFGLFQIGGTVVVQGNHLGVGVDNSTNLITGATNGTAGLLSFTSCAHALVGGPDPADENYIAYGTYGVVEYYSGDVTISRNSFFCNATGIFIDWVLPQPMPFININQLAAGSVSGTAPPGATVELFYDDECPGCEGKSYIGSTVADNGGNWSYPLTATGAIVATATDTYGATSPFSTATLDAKKIVVTNATCGRKNGSIKNISVTSGTQWYWQDASGNIVGTNTDLTDVGPGTYTFNASIGGATCGASSTPYTIVNVNLPAFDPGQLAVTQPSCGQNNGGFQYSGVFDTATDYSWSGGGATVCPDFSKTNPLDTLAPGGYTLQLALRQDPTCATQYGPYTLANAMGPSLLTANTNVIATTCGNANGSVTGMTFQNAVAPVYYAWRNSQGATISTTLDLIHVTAGKYRFVFKDGGSCDTIFTSYYTISDNGGITYDTSKMVITPATCDQPNGSITGILSNDAETYTWISLGSGGSSGGGGSGGGGSGGTGSGPGVGNLEDLTSIDSGVYVLSMSNAQGCQAQTPGFVVQQLGFPSVPQAPAQYIPRNTSATIMVTKPQKGVYELLAGPSVTAAVLDTSSTGVLHSPDVPQDETLYIVYSNGDCTSPVAPVDIKVFDSLKIYIPNAFTPNSGVNSRWHILLQAPVKKLVVSIYDRWGALVFQSNDPNLAWDGTVAGHPLSGTFVYVVAGTDYFNRPFLFKGTLMVIR